MSLLVVMEMDNALILNCFILFLHAMTSCLVNIGTTGVESSARFYLVPIALIS